MKILKLIFLSILGLIAIGLIAAALMPTKYTIVVSESIKKPQKEVYDYIKMFGNQKEYSEWTKPDPTLKPVITGVDGTVGSKSSWKSENSDVGEGSQTIIAMTDNQIDIDLRFIAPMEGKAKVINKIERIDSTSTKVTVEFYSEAPFPINLPSILFGKPMIEKTEKQILTNIKGILESRD